MELQTSIKDFRRKAYSLNDDLDVIKYDVNKSNNIKLLNIHLARIETVIDLFIDLQLLTDDESITKLKINTLTHLAVRLERKINMLLS